MGRSNWLLDRFRHFIDRQLQRDSWLDIAMLSQQVAIAIAFRGEQQRTLWAFERLLASVCQDVSSQRARPWKLALAVGTRNSIRCQAVSWLLLLLAGTRRMWIVSARVVAFGSASRCDKTFFVALISDRRLWATVGEENVLVAKSKL